MSLGQIIRNKRELLKLTLDDVSARANFSKPYLSTIETGKVKNPPSDALLKKLEKILQFEPGILLYIAHMVSMPPDIRQEFESSEAENQRWRQIARNLVNNNSDANSLDSILADTCKISNKQFPIIY